MKTKSIKTPTAAQIRATCRRQMFSKLRPGMVETFGLIIQWIARHDKKNLHAALFTTWAHFEGVCERHGKPYWLKVAETKKPRPVLVRETAQLYRPNRRRKKIEIFPVSSSALVEKANYQAPRYRVQLVREGGASTESPFVECSRDAEQLFRTLPEHCEGVEVLSVLYMTTKNRVIWLDPLFRGTVNTALVFPQEIVKRALLCNAAAVIVGHNHPSGNPEPSFEDQSVTKNTKRACQLFKISLLDHIILGEGRYYSFADKRAL